VAVPDASTDTTFGSLTLQVAVELTSAVVWLLYVPVAVYFGGARVPSMAVALAGVTARLTSTGGSICNGALPLMDAEVAVTVTSPSFLVDTSPLAETVARLESEVLQLAVAKSWVVPSV
jgi:hypothetical protein